MARLDPPFDCPSGTMSYRGIPVEHQAIVLGGRTFQIVSLRDASGLLDQPDFAKRFLEDDAAPYGLELWPAALMLADFVLKGEQGSGRPAIEIGCGLGLVSMAAELNGWRTTATDNEPTSLQFARYNAQLNGVEVTSFDGLDWRSPPTDRRFERVFGADVLYQASDHDPILRCIDALLTQNGAAVLADPHRGIADRFECCAREHAFQVHLITTSTAAAGRSVNGRIFVLRRAAGQV